MAMNLQFRQKILLAASLVVIAAFSLFALYSDYLQRTAISDDLNSYLSEMGDATASNIQNWLSGRILLVENVAQSVANNPAPEAVASLLEQRTLANTFVFTYLGSGDGTFIMRPNEDMPADYDPRARPWYKDAINAGGTTLTEPYIDAATKELIITIATPVKAAGVVGGDLSLKTLVETINSLDFNGIGYAFLVSDTGTILVHPDHNMVMKNLKDLYPTNTPAINSKMSEVEHNDESRLVSFTPVKGLPSVSWHVGLSIDKNKAFAMLSKFRTSALIATLIAVVSIIFLLSVLIKLLMRPLAAMDKAMHDIAMGEGDLTKRLAIHSQDEFGRLATSFNLFVERIHASIREVSSTTTQLNQVAKLVVNASTSSMANSDEQSNRTHSVAAAINELGAAAQEIARNAAQASNQASDARHLAEDGREVVDKTIRAMSELSGKIRASCSNIETLNSKTVNIGQILEVIKSISQQTNLLALNAAIEAARAGEAGRGFAVVADEVRNLAHRTQESAQEIQQMIEELQVGSRDSMTTMTESQRYSEESVEIANLAGERLGSVTQRIGEIDSMNQSVATATEEQTSVVEMLNVDIHEINQLNQRGVENLNETLRACDDLQQQAIRLQQLVSSFRI
jgi:methyl-accepting chemotaxis protein